MALIILKNNKGFSWYTAENIFIKGSFFDSDNNYYEKENTVSYFKKITNSNEFVERIKTINGIFTVIIKTSDEIYIASDTTRIFPLFYTKKNNQLYISDDILYIKNKLKILEFDKKSSEEFLASGYTIGNKTLLKNIFQLQSSEYLYFKNEEKIKQGFFSSYLINSINYSPYTELKQQAINAFENSFKRLITSLNNRQAIIPLSGGYDSRLIAVMLKKFNYTNVLCYTYGKKNNHEIENSRKTAKALNFKWVFIEYNDELLDNYINTDIFKKYAHNVFNFSSLPFLQEYFAVKYLKDHNYISSNSIFIPGHVGDRLGGSLFKPVIPNKIKHSSISQLLITKKFYYSTLSTYSKKEIKKDLELQLNALNQNYLEQEASSVIENYDFKEPIPKILFNSANVYTFFGYEHRFPYWDNELLDFFKNLPKEYKIMKILYSDILKSIYFEKANLNFNKELQSSSIEFNKQKLKNLIKPFAPYFIIKYYLSKNDWLNSSKITQEMIDSMKKNNLKFTKKFNSFNELNIQWYLYFCKDLIKK